MLTYAELRNVRLAERKAKRAKAATDELRDAPPPPPAPTTTCSDCAIPMLPGPHGCRCGKILHAWCGACDEDPESSNLRRVCKSCNDLLDTADGAIAKPPKAFKKKRKVKLSVPRVVLEDEDDEFDGSSDDDLSAAKAHRRPVRPTEPLAQPLSTTVTAADRPDSLQPRVKESSEQQLNAGKGYYKSFAKHAGWEEKEAMVFLGPDGEPLDGKFQHFGNYLMCDCKGMTESAFTNCMKWAQFELNNQLAAIVKGTAKYKGHVYGLPIVADHFASLKSSRQSRAVKGMRDLQIHTDAADIGDQGRIDANFALLSPSPDLRMGALSKASTRAEMNSSLATCARSDDLRSDFKAGIFTQRLQRVGPKHVRGLFVRWKAVVALGTVSKGGKTNSSGRNQYTTTLAAYNPATCAVGAEGHLDMVRYVVLNEPFPNPLDFKALFGSPRFRSAKDPRKPVSYEQQYENIKKVYILLGLRPPKFTHQGRGEGQRLLQSLGLSPDEIKQFAHYALSAQEISYLIFMPLRGVLGHAGSNIDEPKQYDPTHLSVEQSDTLLFAYAPYLDGKMGIVREAIAACGPGAQMEEKRLYMARGFVSASEYLASVSLACAAARPRDAFGDIDYSSPPLYERFSDNAIYKLAFFRSDLFIQYASEVAAAEDRERSSVSASFDSPTRNKMAEVIDAAVIPLQRELGQLTRAVSNLSKFPRVLDGAAVAASPTALAVAPITVAAVESPPITVAAAESVEDAPSGLPALPAAKTHLRVVSIDERTAVHQYGLIDNQSHCTVRSLWEEYTVGTPKNGFTPVRDLEAGFPENKWRSYEGGRKKFAERKVFYDVMEHRILAYGLPEDQAEAAVIIAVQAVLDGVPRVRSATTPNWHRFYAILRAERASVREAAKPQIEVI
jgi:hypothetical protein